MGEHAVHIARLTWAEARAHCESLGGQQLAKIDSAEADASYALLLDGLANSSPRFFWIGGSDSYSEGDWRWLDGSRISYFNWGLAQPADSGNEDCLAIYPDGGHWRWQDSGCENVLDGCLCSPTSPPRPPASPRPPARPPSAPLAPPAALPPGVTARFYSSTTMTEPDPGPRQWASARDYYAGRGQQLAIVRTAADQAALEGVVYGSGTTMFWIGAHTTSAPEGASSFSWVDGTRMGGTRGQ